MIEERPSTTAKRLREIMEKRGLKQVDILTMCRPYCEEMGVKINKSHLSQWLNGVNEPSQKKLTILSKALGVSEPWLMGYDVNPKKQGMKIGTEPLQFSPDAAIPFGIDPDRQQKYQIMVNVVAKMTPDEVQKLIDMTKVMYPDKFSEGDE